jgi:hypothetical protein
LLDTFLTRIVVEEVERGVEKQAIEEKFLDEFQSNRF